MLSAWTEPGRRHRVSPGGYLERPLRATLYLPDAQSGYYRGTRFDWSGVVASLEWNGHTYFGQWFERYDPKLHDAITGPVEEFLTNGAGLGYDEAKPGDTFVRIGVGAVRKPDEPRTASSRHTRSSILANGRSTKDPTGSNSSTSSRHRGLRVRLPEARAPRRDTLVLEHRLKNTGRKAIATSVYKHNFFMLDGQPTGPDVVVRFPFEPRATRALNGLAETRGRDFVYLKELQRATTVQTDMEGFGATAGGLRHPRREPQDRRGRAANGRSADVEAPVRSIRTTVCPEAFLDLRVEPGKESSWRIAYQFYQVFCAYSHRNARIGSIRLARCAE